MKRKTRKVENAPQKAKDGVPNLSLPLPFVHCKIVFNLEEKDRDNFDSKTTTDKSIQEGWKFKNNKYVYYETVTHKDKMNNKEKLKKQIGSQGAVSSEEDSQSESDDDDDLFTASFLKLINRKEHEEELSLKLKHTKASKKELHGVKAESATTQKPATFGSYQFQMTCSKFSLSTSDSNSDEKKSEKNMNVFETKESGVTPSNAEKPFTCGFCGKAFVRKRSLSDHQGTHTGKTPYKCLMCSKLFARKANLNLHLRIHTGEKPFQCTECFKRFSDPSAFKNHMRLHTGERPFKCSECMKTFSQSSTLKCHMRIHNGEKPYHCSTCLKRFTKKSSLLKHEQRSTHRN